MYQLDRSLREGQSSESHAFGAEERQSRVAASPIAGVGTNRVDSGDGRPASSLRTPGRLSGSVTSSFPTSPDFARMSSKHATPDSNSAITSNAVEFAGVAARFVSHSG